MFNIFSLHLPCFHARKAYFQTKAEEKNLEIKAQKLSGKAMEE
jgi:hypothetical protein